MDPGGYFLRLANKYPDNLPDPGGKDTPAQAIRSQIFLPRWAHEPGALHALADLAPSPDLGALLKKYGDPERLTAVMKRIDMSVLELHMLWIEPYLWMEERRGKDIAASNSLNKEGTPAKMRAQTGSKTRQELILATWKDSRAAVQRR